MHKLYRLLRYDWPLHFILLFTNWLPNNVVCLRFRGFLLRPFFGSCGKNLRLARNVQFYNSSNIHIGDDVYFAYGTWLSARGEIHIKDKVTVGPYCVMSSSNHSRVHGAYFNGQAIVETIVIGEGCWLGAHCVVTAGCNVGKGSVIGAGAIVSHDIPGNVLAVGVPAKAIKSYEVAAD